MKLALCALLKGGFMAVLSIDIIRMIFLYLIDTELSNRAIARQLNISPSIIPRYRELIDKHNITKTFILKAKDSELDCIAHKYKKGQHYQDMPDLEYMESLIVDDKYDLTDAYEEYLKTNPSDPYSYPHFVTLIREYESQNERTLLLDHPPGLDIQIDFAGKKCFWKNKLTLALERVEIFVAILPCSQLTFCYALPDQTSYSVQVAMVKMFEFFGGSTKNIIPDNMKTAVIKAGANPIFNKNFQSICLYYNTIPRPARVLHAQDKALVENAVKLVTKWITRALRREDMFSLEELNRAMSALLIRYNSKVSYKLNGSRWQRFVRSERDIIADTLPNTAFLPGQWGSDYLVNRTKHLQINNHKYSHPDRYKNGTLLQTRLTPNTVEIWYDSELIASHKRIDGDGGKTTERAHLCRKYREYLGRSMPEYISWAEAISPIVKLIIESQVKDPLNPQLKELLNCEEIIKLEENYDLDDFLAACNHILNHGLTARYDLERTLKRKPYLSSPAKANSNLTEQLKLPGVDNEI